MPSESRSTHSALAVTAAASATLAQSSCACCACRGPAAAPRPGSSPLCRLASAPACPSRGVEGTAPGLPCAAVGDAAAGGSPAAPASALPLDRLPVSGAAAGAPSAATPAWVPGGCRALCSFAAQEPGGTPCRPPAAPAAPAVPAAGDAPPAEKVTTAAGAWAAAAACAASWRACPSNCRSRARPSRSVIGWWPAAAAARSAWAHMRANQSVQTCVEGGTCIWSSLAALILVAGGAELSKYLSPDWSRWLHVGTAQEIERRTQGMRRGGPNPAPEYSYS